MIRPAPLLLAGFIALVGLACGGGPSAPADLSGNWHYSSNIPGSGATMTLTQSGDAISGSGVTEVEAGASRAFTVSGTLTNGADFSLDLAYDAGTQASFEGTYSPPDTLTGTWTESGTSASRTFTRP